MNKFLIILLAVCLVSVHAFVKRDAPADVTTEKNYLETIQKQLEAIAGTIRENVGKAIDPDAIKKSFDNFVDNVNSAIKPKPSQ